MVGLTTDRAGGTRGPRSRGGVDRTCLPGRGRSSDVAGFERNEHPSGGRNQLKPQTKGIPGGPGTQPGNPLLPRRCRQPGDHPPKRRPEAQGDRNDPYVHLQQVVGPGIDITAERDEQYVRHHRTTAMLDARAGVAELVAEAGAVGIRLGVASSSSHQWVDGHLERIGMLEAFATVRCRDDVQHTKPAPDVYLAVLDDLAASAGEAVAFEDSPNGAQAAKGAGIYTVAVPNDVTRGWPFDHADRVIDTLSGVTVQRAARWLAEARLP